MDTASFDVFVETREMFPSLQRELEPWTNEALYADFLQSSADNLAEPMDYFKYRFFSKSPDERASYVTRRQYAFCCEELNARSEWPKVEDKMLFSKVYARFAARRILDPSAGGRPAFDDLCAAGEELVLKPRAGGYGRGIRFAAPENPDALWDECLACGCLVEEKITQHEDLAALHPSSVNCARVATLVSPCGEAVVLGVVLRTGRSGSITDSGGGIFAPVDAANGLVIGDAVDHFCSRHPSHPDTGLPFRGFRLPRWDELSAKSREAALCVPGLRLVNWDWACDARKGWVLVEGNLHGGFGPCQEALGRGLAAELELAARGA